jgi:hypothetical protein
MERVEIQGWDVEVINALLQNGIGIPPEVWQALGEVTSSPEYQTYLELEKGESNLIEEMENSDEIYHLVVGFEPGEDDHDGGINVAYFFSSSTSQRYHWNADPAWWQDPKWQQDWIYNNAEGIPRALDWITIGGDFSFLYSYSPHYSWGLFRIVFF